MKPTQVTELLANIKTTFVSFFSIVMFVALGVGIFAGISWMAPALYSAADTAFNEGNLHHVQIQFPYGLTDDDLEKLKQIEGVDEVETAYLSFQRIDMKGTDPVVKAQSLPGDIDYLHIVEGALPAKPDEAVINSTLAESLGISVGDTLLFKSDKQASDAAAISDTTGSVDKPAGEAAGGNAPATATQAPMRYLSEQEFTVTGIATSAEYIALSKGSLGFAPMGSGMIDGIAWLPREAFNASAFNGGWPVVNIRSHALEGKGTFGADYETISKDLENRIYSLGDELGDARYRSLHDEAQAMIDSGETQLEQGRSQIADGEAQLEQGQKTLEEGERKIEDGKSQLESGKELLSTFEKQYEEARALFDEKTAELQEELDAAKAVLDDAERDNAEAQNQLTQAEAANNDLQAKYRSARRAFFNADDSLENLATVKERCDDLLQKQELSEKSYWSTVSETYSFFKSDYEAANHSIAALNESISAAAAAYPDAQIKGRVPALPAIADLPAKLGSEKLSSLRSRLEAQMGKADAGLSEAYSAQLSIAGQTFSFASAGEIGEIASETIRAAEEALAVSKTMLDVAEEGYDRVQARYNKETEEVRSKLQDAESQLNAAKDRVTQGEQDLENARAKAEEGKQQLEEKTAQLEGAKTLLDEKTKELENGKRSLGLMKNYGWTVAGRTFNGGNLEISTFAGVTSRLSLSMAALFIIVGLLVTYSAISRIVREQITQIGTKKALGLRSREITTSFLCYAGFAVAAGAIIGLIVGTIVVEGIIAHALVQRFTFESIPPHFDLLGALGMTLVELALVIGATWLACRKILKEQAVDLLRGEKPPAGKTRFFEKWGAWDRLPLYTQTIINNCLNDKRRVFSTIVGVAGCTALVVTAFTLNDDVLASYDKHYESVYGFDTVAYAEQGSTGTAEAISAIQDAVKEKGLDCAVVMRRQQALMLPTGSRGAARIVVPADLEQFASVYHVKPIEGGGAMIANEVWVSAAYGSHMGAKPGDKLNLQDTDGAMHEASITGFYDFYLTYNEVTMSRSTYEHIFETDYEPNAVLIKRGDMDIEELREELSSIEGFDQISADADINHLDFASFANVSRTVVLVYLALSVLMAIVVLLNLNVMFIEEKKRELIVLMINGFSVKDAKRYIYNDTIFLTFVGIVVGLVLGIVMGTLTVASVEPSTANFFKGIDPLALGAASIISAVLSFAMSFIALRRIPAFNLTDINKA